MSRGRIFRIADRLRFQGRALPLILSFWAFFCLSAEPKQKIELSPDEFKAIFLSKLPLYISEWPKGAFVDAKDKVVVGILGKESEKFIENLKSLVKFVNVEGREVVIQEFEDVTQLGNGRCHILFIPAASNPQWLAYNKRQTPQGILTVGEAENFAKSEVGGSFRLVSAKKTLEGNHENAKKAGYRISSQLLKLATKVN